MTTKKFQLNINGFTDGLNTEASVLNVLPSEFMEGTLNVELLQNGSVRRRRGIDYLGEISTDVFEATLETFATTADKDQQSPSVEKVSLTAPNGDLIERVIVSVKDEIHVYENTLTALTDPANPLQTLTTQSHEEQEHHAMTFAQSGNRVYFAGAHTVPGYLKVDTDNTSLTVTSIDVLIRDPAATEANDRVSNNSKWYECIESHTSDTANDEPGLGTNESRFWFQLEGAVPGGTPAWSNATAYDSTFIKQYNKLNTPTATDTFPTTVDFFAGRIWLSGDTQNSNIVYFSQVIANDADIEKFHQFADPFDADDSALVDDDGGTISIQGAGVIHQVLAVGNSIFIGSTTGVHQITGPDGVFKATNFSNNQVLTDGIAGAFNMVKADNEFFIFGQHSIWRSVLSSSLVAGEQTKTTLKNASDNRVASLYQDIPLANKAAGRAIYNNSERRIYYFFNQTRLSWDTTFNHNVQPGYTRHVLIADTRFVDELAKAPEQIKRDVSGAFFLYEFDDGAGSEKPYIAAPFTAPDLSTNTEVVVDNAGAVVVDGAAENVTSADNQEAKDSIFFLSLRRSVSGGTVTISQAFATFETANLQDWSSDSTYTISYVSPLLTGIQTLGDVNRKKAATYIYFVFKKVESGVLNGNNVDLTPGGAFLRTAWNFSTNTTSNKYSGQQQIYVPDRHSYALAGSGLDGHSHTWYKHRVRGRGNSLQVIVEADGDTDYHLIGWNEQFYGKQDV